MTDGGQAIEPVLRLNSVVAAISLGNAALQFYSKYNVRNIKNNKDEVSFHLSSLFENCPQF